MTVPLLTTNDTVLASLPTMAQSNTEFHSFLTSAYAAMTSSFLNLVFPTRFVSLSFFLLLDEPQPRETNGHDYHGDENGVLHHGSFHELRQVRQPVDRCARAPLVKLRQVPLSELLPQGPLSQWT